MNSVTALILTYNEAPNIARTLHALDSIPYVVIIDSFSTDGTLEIAKLAHANVSAVQRPFDTHATQWNFGLKQVTTPWVLSLDADYQVPVELAREIQNVEPAKDVVGYAATFRYFICGRPLRASVYPPRIVLFRRDRGSYYDDGHTQRLRIKGAVGRLAVPIYHDDRKPLSHWLQAQEKYAALEARHLLATASNDLNFADGVRKRIFIAPAVMFTYLLFARGLILDGWPGWFYVFQRTVAEILLSLQLLIARYSLEKGEGEGRSGK